LRHRSKGKVIEVEMRVEELIVAAKIATPESVNAALKRQSQRGGHFCDNLMDLGVVQRETLEAFMCEVPAMPESLAETGISENELLNLLMKHMYVSGLELQSAIIDAVKLPHAVAVDLIERARINQLLAPLSSIGANGLADMRYMLSDKGRHWAAEALSQSRYVGPAPVSIAAFQERLRRQKVANETISPQRVEAAFSGLEISDTFIDQIGPAVQSGRAMLIYGPAGNGKTSVALRLNRVFQDLVYIPYAVMIEGQIMRVFDPALHVPVTPDGPVLQFKHRPLAAEKMDSRWVPCRRPFVVTGGELTLEMLDLRHDPHANFYEAPLHIQASGGCLLIDDFGRQLVPPEHLLNRWIVPLESRIDYLRLHTGTTFSLPFETLVILSTNLDPADLMDPAFLRRIPYKLPVMGPSLDEYQRIFAAVSAAAGLALTDVVFNYIAHEITQVHAMDLAAFQPKFIVDQIVSACRFRQQAPQFDKRSIDYALRNLVVRRLPASAAKRKAAA
jgi:hypothetical protein